MKWERATEIVTLLNPKTSSFEIRVQGLQGGLTGYDIAQAMSGAPSIQRHIIDAVTTNAGGGSEIIEWWFKGVAIRISHRDHWRRCSHKQKMILAHLAYKDVCESKRCEVCKGRKVVPDRGGIMYDCDNCGGDGFIRNEDKDNAKALDVDKSNYSRTWKQRLNSVIMVFDMNYNEAIERIKNKLRQGID